MRSTVLATSLAALVSAAGVSSVAPAQAAAEGIVYSTHANEAAISTQGGLWFLREVEKRTNGKFKVGDTFFSGALLKGPDAIGGIGSGIADAGYFCSGYDITKFPLMSTNEMPYLTEKGDALASAANELYETYEPLREEFHKLNLEMLGAESPSPIIIGVGKDVEIKSAEDLHGLKVRAFGTYSELLKNGGGLIPVVVEVSEITNALQTGLIDGYSVLPLWYPGSANWIPMTTNIISPGMGTYYSCGLAMNLDTYNALDEDVKAVIKEVRKEYPKKTIELTEAGDQVTIEKGKEAAVNFYKFTPEEVDAWKQRLNIDNVRADWAAARQKYTDADVSAYSDKLIETLAKYEPQSDYEQDFPK